MRRRIGGWKGEQSTVLNDFTLTFAKGYDKHKNGYANIKPCPNSQVGGAVYLISEDQFKTLDGYEGVASGVYKRRQVFVEVDGSPTPATTYEMNKELCLLRPASDYLNLVLDGLKEHGYNDNIVKKVQDLGCNSI